MRAGLDTPSAAAAFPKDVAVRAYRDPADMAAYIDLASASFADHPTPVEFTETMITRSHSLPEFDPRVDPARRAGRRSRHARRLGQGPAVRGDDGAPRGSIDFIGVLPAWRRRGLGEGAPALGHRAAAGERRGDVELNVTGSNERALELYRRAGFVPVVEWPHYAFGVRP